MSSELFLCFSVFLIGFLPRVVNVISVRGRPLTEVPCRVGLAPGLNEKGVMNMETGTFVLELIQTIVMILRYLDSRYRK